MSKSYIFWWSIAAVFLFIVIKAGIIGGDTMWIFGPLFWCVVFTFVGYRKWVEYQEYQEDRNIRNDYYSSNTKENDEK